MSFLLTDTLYGSISTFSLYSVLHLLSGIWWLLSWMLCFRYQCLSCSLQQCSALLHNAGGGAFFRWLCSARVPSWTLWSFVLWFKIRTCVYLVWTLMPSSQAVDLLVLSTLEFEHFIKTFLPDYIVSVLVRDTITPANCWIRRSWKMEHLHYLRFRKWGCPYQLMLTWITCICIRNSWYKDVIGCMCDLHAVLLLIQAAEPHSIWPLCTLWHQGKCLHQHFPYIHAHRSQ